jgi:hypothetical protein
MQSELLGMSAPSRYHDVGRQRLGEDDAHGLRPGLADDLVLLSEDRA